MCLATKHKWPRLSKQPMTVYKILYRDANGNLLTPIMDRRVRRDSMQDPILPLRSKKPHIYNGYRFVGEGYIHSLNTLLEARYYLKNIICGLEFISTWIIYRCTIPAWTPYFEGTHNDTASKELIFDEIVDEFTFEEYRKKIIPEEITDEFTFKES